MKRPALQKKQVVILRMAFQAQKVLGTFEKRAQDSYRQPEKMIRTITTSCAIQVNERQMNKDNNIIYILRTL